MHVPRNTAHTLCTYQQTHGQQHCTDAPHAETPHAHHTTQNDTTAPPCRPHHTLSHTHQTSVSACTRKRKVVLRHHTTARDKLLFKFVWKSTSFKQVFAMKAPPLTCALQVLKWCAMLFADGRLTNSSSTNEKANLVPTAVELPLQSHTFGLPRRHVLQARRVPNPHTLVVASTKGNSKNETQHSFTLVRTTRIPPSFWETTTLCSQFPKISQNVVTLQSHQKRPGNKQIMDIRKLTRSGFENKFLRRKKKRDGPISPEQIHWQ